MRTIHCVKITNAAMMARIVGKLDVVDLDWRCDGVLSGPPTSKAMIFFMVLS